MDGRYMNGVYHDDDEIRTAWTSSLVRSGGGSTERSGRIDREDGGNVRLGRPSVACVVATGLQHRFCVESNPIAGVEARCQGRTGRRRAIFSRRQPSCSTHARSTYHRQRRGEENQPGRREKSRSPTQSRCMRASEKGLPAALACAADARLYGLEPKRPGGEGGRVFATSLCRSWRDRWQPCVARYWGLTILGVCPARRPGHYRPD